MCGPRGEGLGDLLFGPVSQPRPGQARDDVAAEDFNVACLGPVTWLVREHHRQQIEQFVGSLGCRLVDDVFEGFVQPGIVVIRGREGAPIGVTGEAFVEDLAQGEDVSGGQVLLVPSLGGHVGCGTQDHRLCVCLACVELGPRHSEVQQLHLTLGTQDDVAWLEVAVDEVQRAAGVGGRVGGL